MPLMKRPGVVGRSIREYVTEPAAALAFFETKRRPVPVAAHSVPVSLAARSIATTFEPARVPRTQPSGRCPGGPDPLEVAAARVCGRRRELGAVRLEEVAATTPVLGAPDALRALEDRARSRRVRIGDHRRVELRALGARTMSPVIATHFEGSPPRKFASFAWPVNVLKRRSECGVEAGLAAVAPDRLVPRLVAREADPGAIVLRAALEAARISRVDREALELQRRQAAVQVVERRRQRDRSCLQSARSTAFSPRESHWAEMSA